MRLQNGDADACVPYKGNVEWIKSLVKQGDLEASVEAALGKAFRAVDRAEGQLARVTLLRSARPPSALRQWVDTHPWAALRLAQALKAAGGVGVGAFALASARLPSAARALVALAMGLAMALYGLRNGSLDASGAAGAGLVGWGTMGADPRVGLLVILFFLSSSQLTAWKSGRKAGLDEEHKGGKGRRDWRQVGCNGAVPTVLALAAAAVSGAVPGALGGGAPRAYTALAGATLGYLSCCCADTWASEVGVLSKRTPRLITTLRPVRRGTNGGVSALGLGASLAGGLFIGLSAVGLSLPLGLAQPALIAICAAGGLLGSLVDSLCGATLQYSGYSWELEKVVQRPGDGVARISGRPLLDNNQVNLLSASITACIISAACLNVL